MGQTASLSLRDRLIAIAAFAYALSHVYVTGFNVVWAVRWSDGAWEVAVYFLAAAWALGVSGGSVVIGVGFLGGSGSRALRVRAGAYLTATAYLLASATILMVYGYMDIPATASHWRAHAGIVANAGSYLAGGMAAFVFARAYRKGSRSRTRALGGASICLGAYAALGVLARVLNYWVPELTTHSALDIADFGAVLVGALAAVLAFFGRRRSPEWVRELRYARLLLIFASAMAISAVFRFSVYFIQHLHYLPYYWDSWLAVLAALAYLTAGICLCIAFVVFYRAVPRPVKPESDQSQSMGLPECPGCGVPYDPSEYREDAVWRCMSCGGKLRLV